MKKSLASRIFLSSSLSATQRLAEKVSRFVQVGDVILLIGNLGAGKTSFVQGFSRGMGIKEIPQSPTFTLAQTLPGKIPVHHLDFYRLKASELMNMGIQDYLLGQGEIPPGVILIEWANLFKQVWPSDYLKIEISIEGKNRRIKISAQGHKMKARFKKMIMDIKNEK
ncbi:MAG: tRNA (adenosine(37)-N6)-threonylcarbamoyltransferase complex ATPase subunit type 1 TsaE [Elusimicrobiota bacterium]